MRKRYRATTPMTKYLNRCRPLHKLQRRFVSFHPTRTAETLRPFRRAVSFPELLGFGHSFNTKETAGSQWWSDPESSESVGAFETVSGSETRRSEVWPGRGTKSSSSPPPPSSLSSPSASPRPLTHAYALANLHQVGTEGPVGVCKMVRRSQLESDGEQGQTSLVQSGPFCRPRIVKRDASGYIKEGARKTENGSGGGTSAKGKRPRELNSLPVEIEGRRMVGVLDTGSPSSLCPKSIFEGFPSNIQARLSTAKCRFTSLSGHDLGVIGELQLSCKIGDNPSFQEKFYVTENNNSLIFGTSMFECAGMEVCLDFERRK